MNNECRGWLDHLAEVYELEPEIEPEPEPEPEPEIEPDYSDIRARCTIDLKNTTKFDHNEFSKWLLNESGEHFATIEDSAEVFYYDAGIYVAGGESRIKKLMEDVMEGDMMTNYNRNEVLGHVRALTTVDRRDFDKDRDVITMRNGVYRISNGTLAPHTPKYRSFCKIDITFDPSATCPTIDTFIQESAEEHRVDAVYEIMGYALLPDKRLKKAVILVGPSDSGKSTLMNLLKRFIGLDMVVDINPIVLANYAHASVRLFGMLANCIDDLGDTPLTETGLLKTIISSASIEANQKGGKQFSFSPNVLMIFGCNTVPRCSDPYLMDKFDILQFLNSREGKTIDRQLIDKMSTDEELSGLFNAAMRGVATAIKNDCFTGSYTLDDRRKAYEYLSNPLAQFIDECCDVSDNEAMIEKRTFRKAYVNWSRAQDHTAVQVGAQTTYLQDMGIILRKIGSRDDRSTYYVGIEFAGPE